MNLRFSLLVCTGLLLNLGVHGQSIVDVRLHDSHGKIVIPDSLELLVDPSGALGIDEVRSGDFLMVDSISDIVIPHQSALWAVWHLTNSGKDTASLVSGTGEGDTVDC